LRAPKAIGDAAFNGKLNEAVSLEPKPKDKKPADGFFDRASGDFHQPQFSLLPAQVKNEPGYLLVVLGQETHKKAQWRGSFHEDLSLREGAAAKILEQLSYVLEGDAAAAADNIHREISEKKSESEAIPPGEADLRERLQ